jgi:hypothetical protein
LLAVICILSLVLPAAALAQERGGTDPYVVNTNYFYDTELGEGYFLAGGGVDPDPGRGVDFIPQYNDYDWMISDPVGIRQSELDAFRARCDSYTNGYGLDGIQLVGAVQLLEQHGNSVQLIPNLVLARDGEYLKGSFSIFVPPNYYPSDTLRYPIVVQIPGYSSNSLNELVFDPTGNSLPLGFLTTVQSYLNDPNGRGVIYVVWNAGGYGSVGANDASREAISYLIRFLRTRCRIDQNRVIARGSSRGAFAALTLAENIIHGHENYNVIGVFASAPPLSIGSLSTIPIATNPDLANLYRLYTGEDGYKYSGAAPPGAIPQPALLPVFGTSDPLEADMLCPDYTGHSGGIDNLSWLQGKYIYLAAGTHDSFFPVTNFITMDNNLSERGIGHTTFLVLQGGHGPMPQARLADVFSDFIFKMMSDPKFDPAAYVPPAAYKHGVGEAARNYLLDTDLVNHRPTDDQGASTMKTLFLKEMPFSATMPRRLGSNVYGTGTPNVADEPGIVHLSGAAGKQWELYLFNPTNSDLVYQAGQFDDSEIADVTWWSGFFPVSASGNCGPGGSCTPGNDWLRWSALYEGEHATGFTNYVVGGNRISLDTEIIDRQATPRELRVNYLDSAAPLVAMGVDLFPAVVAELRTSQTSGVAPFTVNFGMTVANNSANYRRMAFQVDTRLASGYFIPRHRAGFTNIGPYDRFEISVNMNLPAYSALNGDNRFTLRAEDVTPAPYNQPPFPPSGAGDTHEVTINVTVP